MEGGGRAVVLGEMFGRPGEVNQTSQRDLSVHKATWFAPGQPAVVTNFRGEGWATRDLPHTGWPTSTGPGLHVALGGWRTNAREDKKRDWFGGEDP